MKTCLPGGPGRSACPRAWHTRLIGLLALGMLAWSMPARATRQVVLAPEQLAQLAHCVVLGTVRSLETTRDPAGRIYTRLHIAVEERWKGPRHGSFLDVEMGGGILGETRVAATSFEWPGIGERAVWFLVRHGADRWSVVGLDQGCFRVARETSQDPAVWNSQSGRPPAGLPPPLAQRSQGSWTLRELKRRVIEAAGEGA